jgi:hypothetical protein
VSKTDSIGTPNVRHFAPPISVAEAKQVLKKRSKKQKTQDDGQASDLIAAVRRATTVLKGYNEADVTWTQTRTMTLMLDGVIFVEAVSQAAEECSARIKRKLLETPLVVAPEARGGRNQQPTLKTSLGDLLAAKRRT